MAKTYAQLLKQGIDELLEITSTLKDLGPNVTKVRRLKYIAGFLGLQKLSDLGFWLEDWLDASGPKLSPMGDETRSLFCNLMTEVLTSVEPPREFGEFINADSIALRPLFRKEIPVHQLFSQLKDIHPIQFHKRNIFKLPISVQEAYPYSLRLPARFLEKADLDSYLTLLYVDLGRSGREDWRSYADVLGRLVREGVILYQGAMEVSWDFLRSRKPLLPYYLLYSGEEDPREFLVRWGLSGHVMRMLKRPGEPWSSQGQTLEGGESDFWDIYDLESGDLRRPKNQATGEGLLAAALKVKSQMPEFDPKPASPPVPVEPVDSQPTDPLPEEFFFELKEGDSDLPSEPLPEQPSAPIEKKTPPVVLQGEPLTEIPFTLEDLGNPDFSWPVGLDSLPKEVLQPTRKSSPGEKAEESGPPWPAGPMETAPEESSWMPEFRAPSWEDHADELSESEEILRTTKTNPLVKMLLVLIFVSLGGFCGYLGWSLQTRAGIQAYTRGQESAFLYGQLLERMLDQGLRTADLFIPSVEGMAPESVTQDFFTLFYPDNSGVAGIGIKTENSGLTFYSAGGLSQESLTAVSSQVKDLPLDSSSFRPLSENRGVTLWSAPPQNGTTLLLALNWISLIPEPGKGQGVLVLGPDGTDLYRSGALWNDLKDFSFPLSSFPTGVQQGPLNYQDVQGRQVLGGFYRSPRGVTLCVVQKPESWETLVQLP